MQQYSAEWLRGALWALRRLKPEVWDEPQKALSMRDLRWCVDNDYQKAVKLLAAAEACEAGKPTAAQVIAKCKEFLVAISLDMPEKIDERMKYRDYQFGDTELIELNEALAAIAAWEANNDR